VLGKSPRCKVSDCGSECVHNWIAAILVIAVTTLVLTFPFLDALGIKQNSAFVLDTGKYVAAGVLVGVWLIAIVVGCTRRHENELACVIDSFSIPGILAALFLIGQHFGIHVE
jgi:branched-subunit amino acid transport protein AzlD